MKYTFRILLLIIILAISEHPTFAQLSKPGMPRTIKHESLKIPSTISRKILPQFDVDKLIEEDKREQLKGVPFRFGNPINVDFTLQNSGKWENVEKGKVWRLKIQSDEAFTLNLIFRKYRIPKGAELFVFNPETNSVLGAFSSANNKEHGKFATGLVKGDYLILEYFEPNNAEFIGQIEISKVIHGYVNIFDQNFDVLDFGDAGDCNVNINCEEGADWQIEKRSVMMILAQDNSRICTGAMINNARVDLTPYLLTGYHCFNDPTEVETWVYMFNYESESCENVEGSTDYVLQGSSLVASNIESDFALVLLDEPPPDSFNVHFAGWNSEEINSNHHVIIHHPDGDIKKISIDADTLRSVDWEGDFPGSHWEISNWEVGTTEKGSSGAPIFDEKHRIIGQLHGGEASCTNNAWDSFGKFSYSWDHSNSPTLRLKDWLDPDNSGITFLDGWDPSLGKRDSISPTEITDLQILDSTSNGFVFSWTAPFDTTFGGVRGYDLRYSLNPIENNEDFNAASQYRIVDFPADSGETENFTITGFEPDERYYFKILSYDRWGNKSVLSNSVQAKTLSNPLISVSKDSLSFLVKSGDSVKDSISISNISLEKSTLEIEVYYSNTFENSQSINPNIHLKAKESIYAKSENVSNNGILNLGGPDQFGYRWFDSNEEGIDYEWIDISNTGNIVSFSNKDDGYSDSLSLGFSFPFYGNEYTGFWILSNGLITFENYTKDTYNNRSIPNSAVPNNLISPLWDDLSGVDSGKVYFYSDERYTIVQFVNWNKYSVVAPAPGEFEFQVILYPNGEIRFNYKKVIGLSNEATVGIENSDGTDGLLVAYNTAYLDSNLTVKLLKIPEWLSFEGVNGYIRENSDLVLVLNISSKDLAVGKYKMNLFIDHNDNTKGEIVIPVSLEVVDSITSIEDQLPTKFTLEQNYPNPFNPETVISFTIPTEEGEYKFDGYVSLKIYDVLGNEIKTLLNEQKSPGKYSVKFDAGRFASGIYFYKIDYNHHSEIKKMILMK